MKRLTSGTIASLVVVFSATAAFGDVTSKCAESANTAVAQYFQTRLAFTENQGQWDERAKYRANSGGVAFWFTSDGIYYQFTHRIAETQDTHDRGHLTASSAPRDEISRDTGRIEQLVIKVSFVGANPDPEIVGEGLMEYRCNYFIGNDPSSWHADVPNYTAVRYREIYPGVDIRFSGSESGKAAYEFIASPGADLDQINLKFECTTDFTIDEDGRLITGTGWGVVVADVIHKPNDKLASSAGLLLLSENTAELHMADLALRQPASLLLTLDYSTYLGGSDVEWGDDIAVDNNGAAVITGETASIDFPTLDPYQTDQPNGDVFITKLSSSGNSLIYSTYLGGSGGERSRCIAEDDSGCVYVTGYTYSTDFPLLNAYQTGSDPVNGDIFVTKLSSSGNTLVYSTYLGGNDQDLGRDIAVDNSGSAYITGSTFSTDFPMVNEYQTYQAGRDAFVTKFSISGSSLVYSTYLGGNDYDYSLGIAVDDLGAAYVAGGTRSTDFPTLNPYQTDQPEMDVFVTKLTVAGNSLAYSTYLGGSLSDHGRGIAVDEYGSAYVLASTASSDYPIVNPYQTDQGGGDVVITKLSNSGSTIVYSTYLGGSDDDRGNCIAVDNLGAAYVTGETASTDFPMLKPYQGTYQGGSSDVFVTKLTGSGSSLAYSTYLGGDSVDYGYGIAVDEFGSAFVTGNTESADFPTVNPYMTDRGGADAFVSKLTSTVFLCADVDATGAVDIDDVVWLIAYIFAGGTPPEPLEAGDADCSGEADIDDVVYIIQYIFAGGPSPCDPDNDGVPNC